MTPRRYHATPLKRLRRQAEISAKLAAEATLAAKVARKKAIADAQAYDLAVTQRAEKDAKRGINLIATRASILQSAFADDPNWLERASPEFRAAYRQHMAKQVDA